MKKPKEINKWVWIPSAVLAFVMLALFPKTALLLFLILFLLGIIWAFVIDRIMPLFRIDLCAEC